MDYFSGDGNENTVLRLDPRTKLLLFLTGGFVAINCYDVFLMIPYALGLCLIMALSGKPAFAAKAALAFALVVYVRTMVMSSPPTTGGELLIPLVSGLCTLVLFVFPIMVSFMLIIKTTRISQFLAAFQHMHLPMSVIVPVAVFFRFIPTVQEEWNSITKAMAFRGIAMTPASVLRHPGVAAERILVPMLFSSMDVMDELSAAALARGLDSNRARTCYEEVRLGWIDYLVMALLVFIIIFILMA